MSKTYWEMPSFERKQIPTFVKSVDEDQGIVDHFVAVMGNRDSGGDRISPGAFTKTLTERGLRVKVLDQHGVDSVTRIVGKPISMREVGKEELTPEVFEYAPDATGGLLATTQFAVETTRGADVFKLIKGGFAPESSIGYDTIQSEMIEEKDTDGNKITTRLLKELRLWEYSSVIWGMNPATATVSAKEQKPVDVTENTIRVRVRDPDDFQQDSFRTITISEDDGIQAVIGKPRGKTTTEIQTYIFAKDKWTAATAQAWVDEHQKCFVIEVERKVEEVKGATGKAGLPLADRDHAWDATAAESRVRGWAGAEDEPNAKYRQAFFWYDSDNADNFTAYKLLFADVFDGTLKAVPRGVFAVAAVLQGARGGVNIPSADKQKIKAKVGSYYAKMRGEFDDDAIEPPWEKMVIWEEIHVKMQEYYGTLDEDPTDEDVKSAVLHAFVSLFPQEEKIGRAISASNAARIGSAITALIQLLEDAGIDIPGYGAEEEEKETPSEEIINEEEVTKDLETLMRVLEIEFLELEIE